MVSAAIGTVFVQESAEAASRQWRSVADQLRDKFPKLAALMDEAENDVSAYMTSPRAHWTQIYSTNPLQRLNAEVKQRTNVVGVGPNCQRRCDHAIGRGDDAGAERRVKFEPTFHAA